MRRLLPVLIVLAALTACGGGESAPAISEEHYSPDSQESCDGWNIFARKEYLGMSPDPDYDGRKFWLDRMLNTGGSWVSLSGIGTDADAQWVLSECRYTPISPGGFTCGGAVMAINHVNRLVEAGQLASEDKLSEYAKYDFLEADGEWYNADCLEDRAGYSFNTNFGYLITPTRQRCAELKEKARQQFGVSLLEGSIEDAWPEGFDSYWGEIIKPAAIAQALNTLNSEKAALLAAGDAGDRYILHLATAGLGFNEFRELTRCPQTALRDPLLG